MSCTIESIYYYPLKSGNSIALKEAYLTLAGIEGDRKWALVSPGFTALPKGEWMACDTFERFKIQPKMATWLTDITETGVQLRIEGQNFDLIEGEQVMIGDRLVQLARADKGYWDDSDASISIINLATLEAIEKIIGITLDPIRFRANIYVRAEPWSEFQWLGKQINFGESCLEIIMPTGRCRAISVHPDTGEISHNIPAQLAKYFGHTYCGVYARVVNSGRIAVGATGSISSIESENSNDNDNEASEHIPAQLDFPNMQLWPRCAQVVDIVDEAVGIRSLWLRDSLAQTGAWDAYKPGQHVRLHALEVQQANPNLDTASSMGSYIITTWRSYTVSGRKDDLFRITVKLGTGGGSGRLHTLGIHDTVLMTGPAGELTVPHKAQAIYLITAGIGITPAVAMLEDMVALDIPIHFVHTTKSNQVALWHEVASFVEAQPNVSGTLFISDAESALIDQFNLLKPSNLLKTSNLLQTYRSLQLGRPNLVKLAAEVSQANAHVIVCGTPSFSSAILTALADHNIPPERIGSETFISTSINTELLEPPTVGPHKVRFIQSDIDTVWHKEDGTLLDLAERYGLVPAANCRAGICRICQVELDRGEIAQLAGNAALANRVLLCCSVPTSDIEIQL